MLVEPRAPDEADRIAELERRPQPRRPSAAHEAEMAAMRAGHRFDDRRGLAVPADADDEPLVAPFHERARLRFRERADARAGARARASRRSSSASPDMAPRNAASPAMRRACRPSRRSSPPSSSPIIEEEVERARLRLPCLGPQAHPARSDRMAAEKPDRDDSDAEDREPQAIGQGHEHADRHEGEGEANDSAPAIAAGKFAHRGRGDRADEIDAIDQPIVVGLREKGGASSRKPM